MTLSPSASASSQPSSYDIPEQPPPTTRMRRPHSGFPSSRRRSATFLAAVSVIVSMSSSSESVRISSRSVSQDSASRQQREVLERGSRGERRHEDDGPRHVFR